MKLGRILLAAVIMWVVGTAMAMLTCGHLFNWVYQIPPIIWKDPAAIMAMDNMIGSNAVGLASALIFALVYAVFYKGIPGNGIVKGMVYGFFVWMLAQLSGMSSMPFFMTISTTVVIYWILQGLVVNLINGIILGAIYRE